MVNLFVQARLGSTRLPGKMLANLGGRSLLEWVLIRVNMSQQVARVCLLTSSQGSNSALMEIAKKSGVECFVGDELDVASRFVKAAQLWPASHFVRVCADNPFVCPREIDRLVEFHIAGGFDYSFNHIPALNNNYVDGFGAEIFTSNLMGELGSVELSMDEREHVTRYFWNHRELLKFGVLKAPAKLSMPRLSFDIDTSEDLDKVAKVIGLISPEMSGEEIISVLRTSGNLDMFCKQTN